MSNTKQNWRPHLERWREAGFLGETTALAIQDYEAERAAEHGGNLQGKLAVALGGLLLAAGLLLFVAAHWDMLAPGARFALVLTLIAAIHLSGAFVATRFPVLSITLHAVGSVGLGAGIFLSGQIFHLQEHWPDGVMLWALGTGVAWLLLRDWPQVALTAILTPTWLIGEWLEAMRYANNSAPGAALFTLILAIGYLSALPPGKTSAARKTLFGLGCLSFMPAVLWIVRSSHEFFNDWQWLQCRTSLSFVYVVACTLPLLLAWCLRGKRVWVSAVAMVWALVLSLEVSLASKAINDWPLYGLLALGAVDLILWGLYEGRRALVNLGLTGFALTVLSFYFANVFDKFGRSISLIGLGLLFITVGWLLEKTRRRLTAYIEGDRT